MGHESRFDAGRTFLRRNLMVMRKVSDPFVSIIRVILFTGWNRPFDIPAAELAARFWGVQLRRYVPYSHAVTTRLIRHERQGEMWK